MVLLAIPITVGLLVSLAGVILTFKHNPEGLVGFGTFNGPRVDKNIRLRARLGLTLLILGFVMQFAAGIASLFINRG